MIITEPNAFIGENHDRMQVLLSQEQFELGQCRPRIYGRGGIEPRGCVVARGWGWGPGPFVAGAVAGPVVGGAVAAAPYYPNGPYGYYGCRPVWNGAYWVRSCY
jgi:hypothetical protein